MLKRLFLFEQSYVFLSPFNTFCLLFTFVGEVNTVVMHDCMTFRQHAHTLLSWTEARPKVSAKMFLHDLFPSATNSWCAHYWWECCCAHRLTHHNFWDLTCSKDWVLVKVAEVVGNAVCRFVGASLFWSYNLMATSSHSLKIWNGRLLEVLGTRMKDNVLFAESITFSS